ncbi:MAG: cation diffusion facilitator family transporter [Gammaproteobacteria bacterium]|nr:cation diffusion facilitator family transporter [Gammaproteobacteria bacterium]
MSEHHHHAHRDRPALLGAAVLLTLGFAMVEAAAGWWSGSLALLGDAAHMVTDTAALGLAAFAAWIMRRPPSARHSYGLGRAEVVVALINGLLMLAIVIGIGWAAVERLHAPQPVAGLAVMGVAAVGLLVNALVARLLLRGEQSLNTRGALLHVLGDLFGSVAALASGTVIYFTGWTPIDPLLSLLICALILYSSLRLLRDTLHVIMEGVPPEIDLAEVGQALAGIRGVISVHDLHIWTLSSGVVALSAHVVVNDLSGWEEILGRLRALLHERYAIDHVTLQPEPCTHTLKPMRHTPQGTPV